MKERFKDTKRQGQINITLDKKTGRVWSAEKRVILDSIEFVCRQYQQDGYTLTLRQLYYQLVGRDWIPNHDKVYNKLSGLKDEVVYSGRVDWNMFEDRGRIPSRSYFEHSVRGALQRTVDSFRLDKQKNQQKHIEVWTEKDAISNILKRVTDPLTIYLVVNKGYSSSTAMYGAYRRFLDKLSEGQEVVVLYFGDHDPSGLDMIRDIRERILFFLENGVGTVSLEERVHKWSREFLDEENFVEEFDDNNFYIDRGDGEIVFNWMKLFLHRHFTVEPIGLTMKQIKEHNLPHNPAKITDPRAKKYVRQFGQRSWEVDALSPKIMTGIVKEAINRQLNLSTLEDVKEEERKDKQTIQTLIDDIDE